MAGSLENTGKLRELIDKFQFAEPCNTPGVTKWSRRGRSCYLFLLRHFSRALDAATGEPDYEMLWRRE